MKKIRNFLTWEGPEKEKNNSPSLTVPDQTMSISEIVKRHVRGIEMNVRTPIFHDEETIDQESGTPIKSLDLVDIHQELTEINNRMEQRKAEKQRQYEDQKKSELARLEELKRQQIISEFQESQKKNKTE